MFIDDNQSRGLSTALPSIYDTCTNDCRCMPPRSPIRVYIVFSPSMLEETVGSMLRFFSERACRALLFFFFLFFVFVFRADRRRLPLLCPRDDAAARPGAADAWKHSVCERGCPDHRPDARGVVFCAAAAAQGCGVLLCRHRPRAVGVDDRRDGRRGVRVRKPVWRLFPARARDRRRCSVDFFFFVILVFWFPRVFGEIGRLDIGMARCWVPAADVKVLSSRFCFPYFFKKLFLLSSPLGVCC
jgi:hypothetical protein